MRAKGRARSAPWWLGVVIVGAAGASLAADIGPDSTYWRRQQEGWFWYRDPPPARLPKPDPPRASVPAAQPPEVLAHAALKARLEQALAVATMNPSPENLRAYLALQTAAVRQASAFADAWQQVVWATPEFDFTLERPVNATALEVYDRERQAAQIRAAEQLARTHVLFFLFRSDCPYCQQFAPLLQRFEQKFGLPVFAISLDGGTLPEFPRARIDNGIAATLNVAQVPALFLASPRTNVITPIGYGVLSETELLERLQAVATPAGNAAAATPSPPVALAGVR